MNDNTARHLKGKPLFKSFLSSRQPSLILKDYGFPPFLVQKWSRERPKKAFGFLSSDSVRSQNLSSFPSLSSLPFKQTKPPLFCQLVCPLVCQPFATLFALFLLVITCPDGDSRLAMMETCMGKLRRQMVASWSWLRLGVQRRLHTGCLGGDRSVGKNQLEPCW